MSPAHSLSPLGFRLMALEFRIRDWLRPPRRILREIDLQPGMTILDFGCGPGGFALAAARQVAPSGRVCALDVLPIALESVRRRAARQRLDNIRPMAADRIGEIPDASVDRVLLFDVLHDIPEPGSVLAEIRRVLKPDGLLSVSDHHLLEADVRRRIGADGCFHCTGRGRRTIRFAAGPVPSEAR